jgi:hypothetical protein
MVNLTQSAGPWRQVALNELDRATLKALGAAESLPPLPDFELVLQRSRTASPVADHLSEMIINFYELSTALKPASGVNDQQLYEIEGDDVVDLNRRNAAAVGLESD